MGRRMGTCVYMLGGGVGNARVHACASVLALAHVWPCAIFSEVKRRLRKAEVLVSFRQWFSAWDARTPWATEGCGEDTPGGWGHLGLLKRAPFPHSQLRSLRKDCQVTEQRLPGERPLDCEGFRIKPLPLPRAEAAPLQEVTMDMPEWGGRGFESHAAALALPSGEGADPPHLDCLVCIVRIKPTCRAEPLESQ